RKNHAFQLVIERFRFGSIVGRSIACSGSSRFADTPSCDAFDVAFHPPAVENAQDRKSTRLNSSHLVISYAVFCLKKKKQTDIHVIAHRTGMVGIGLSGVVGLIGT